MSFPPGPGSRPSQERRGGTVTALPAETTQCYFQASSDSRDKGEALAAEPGAGRQCFREPAPGTDPEPGVGTGGARHPTEKDSDGSWRHPVGVPPCCPSWGLLSPRSEHGPLGRLLLPPAATRERLMLESRWSPPVLVPSTSPGHTLPSPPARTCAPEARGPRVCSVPASLTFSFSTRVSGLSVGRKGFSDAQEVQCDSHLKKGGLVAWKPLSIVTLVHRSSVY